MEKQVDAVKPEIRMLHSWDGKTSCGRTILNVGLLRCCEPRNYLEIQRRSAREYWRRWSTRKRRVTWTHSATSLHRLLERSAIHRRLPTSFQCRPPGMDKAGMDMLQVLLDRCHQHKMQFIADIRMNDGTGTIRRMGS